MHIRKQLFLLITVIPIACTSENSAEVDAVESEKPAAAATAVEAPETRPEAESQLEKAQLDYEADANDQNRRAYAQTLFRVGNIWDANKIIEPLATEDSEIAMDVELGAEAALLTFDLDRAERLYNRLAEITEEGSEEHDDALTGLTMTYYQSQQFHKAKDLPPTKDETEENASLRTFMKRFEGEPYQIEWTTEEKTGHMPFINDIREPGKLPIVAIAINGESFEFILDTGGDRLYFDQSNVEKVDLNILATTQAEYAYTGGETVDEAYGVADIVEVDGVIVRNVPIHVGQLKNRGVNTDGIVTTGFLKQFLSTMDYDNNEITLRERSTAGKNDLLAALSGKGVIGMPFFMAATHLMFAKGTFNGHPDLNMFMDSGLAMSMPGVIPNETTAMLELEQTEVAGTKYYWVPLESHGLNNLVQGAGQALGNVFVEEDMYWRLGFAFDGLLSHQYLWPLGSWTVDFDDMVYYFPAQPEQAAASETKAPAKEEKVKIKVENTDPYVGSYEVAPGVALEITAKDGVVFLQAPGQQAIGMEAYDDGTFGIPLAGAEIEFQGDPATGITGLVMTQGTNVTKGEKK